MGDRAESIYVAFDRRTGRCGLLVTKPKFLSLPESVVHKSSYLFNMHAPMEEYQRAITTCGQGKVSFFLDFEDALDRLSTALRTVTTEEWTSARTTPTVSANKLDSTMVGKYKDMWGLVFSSAGNAMDYIEGRQFQRRLHVRGCKCVQNFHH